MADHAEEGLNDITGRIIGCAFKVSNCLGPGFLESVYENALRHELGEAGLQVGRKDSVAVRYDGVIVGVFTPDIVVNGIIIVELKASKAIDDASIAQCINYLCATGSPICLLLNFGTPRLGIRRILNGRGMHTVERQAPRTRGLHDPTSNTWRRDRTV